MATTTQENPENQNPTGGEDFSYLHGLKRFISPPSEDNKALVIGGGKNAFIPPIEEKATSGKTQTDTPNVPLLD